MPASFPALLNNKTTGWHRLIENFTSTHTLSHTHTCVHTHTHTCTRPYTWPVYSSVLDNGPDGHQTVRWARDGGSSAQPQSWHEGPSLWTRWLGSKFKLGAKPTPNMTSSQLRHPAQDFRVHLSRFTRPVGERWWIFFLVKHDGHMGKSVDAKPLFTKLGLPCTGPLSIISFMISFSWKKGGG